MSRATLLPLLGSGLLTAAMASLLEAGGVSHMPHTGSGDIILPQEWLMKRKWTWKMKWELE